MTVAFPFDNTYARLPEGFFTRLGPTPVRAPRLLAVNRRLADELGLTLPGDDAGIAEVFSGNALPGGAEPLAQVYAGHQFGGWSPRLGDGRALLLGEVTDRSGQRRDIQLKGAGPTPYSRMGDGRAWLGPVIREYLVSEAMHALGVPTTRALAAVATGETVLRDAPLPGAVLTRVAASHIRVGTFQYFAARGDTAALRTLTDYTLARHYPEGETALDLLRSVIVAQTRLIAQWMGLGFIHGVMNTDNMTLSGETIDYGPCAFMEAYAPGTVYSSIDHYGRYAYANQPQIGIWNLAQLASALLPLIDADEARAVEIATEAVDGYRPAYEAAWTQVFGAKLGVAAPDETTAALATELLELMAAAGTDFTLTFRGLAQGAARALFADPAGFDAWAARWQAHAGPEAAARSAAANPAVIPRNHRVEEAIQAAVAGDLTPFERLGQALATPFTEPADAPELMRPAAAHEAVHATFCGT
jgi:uncharacterized protein YdiU (UPF0061 family)